MCEEIGGNDPKQGKVKLEHGDYPVVTDRNPKIIKRGHKQDDIPEYFIDKQEAEAKRVRFTDLREQDKHLEKDPSLQILLNFQAPRYKTAHRLAY